MHEELRIMNIESAEHYFWGDGCVGWHLLKRNDMSVIQERVPPGKSETTHIHKLSRQFFFILEGEATIATETRKVVLSKHQGIEIPPGMPHQFCNESSADVSFLVFSVPQSHGDRYDAY